MLLTDISKYVDYGLWGLFGLAILFAVIAAIRGAKKGIFRVTWRIMFIATSITVLFVALEPLSNFIGGFDLTKFGLNQTLNFSVGSGTISVPVTTMYGTIEELCRQMFTALGLEGSNVQLANMAKDLATSVLRFVIYFVGMILIAILGNLIAGLLWNLFFKKLQPKISKKKGKFKPIAAILNGVKCLVVWALFLSPFTSLINGVNQAYQKHKDHLNITDETVSMVTSALDAYNDSLFAKTFFNWTVDENGATWDVQLFNKVTTVLRDESETNFLEMITSVLDLGMSVLDKVNTTTGFTEDYASLLTTDTIAAVFDFITENNLIMASLPIALNFALNIDAVSKYVDTQNIDVESIDWAASFDSLESLVTELIDSGIIDQIMDENGSFNVKPAALLEYAMNDENFAHFDNAVLTIDSNSLLNAIVPAVVAKLATDNPTVSTYLPNDINEIKTIKWGNELSIILNFAHDVYKVDPELIQEFLGGKDDTPAEPQSRVRLNEGEKPGEGGENPGEGGENPGQGGESSFDIDSIVKSIIPHLGDIGKAIYGTYDEDGNLTGVDASGVSTSGKCLLDLQLLKYATKPLLEMVVSKLGNEPREGLYSSAISSITTGTNWRKNLKNEFHGIFGILDCFKDNVDDILSLVNGGKIDLANIPEGLITSAANALKKADESELITTAAFGLLHNLFSGDTVAVLYETAKFDKELVLFGLNKVFDQGTLGETISDLLNVVDDALFFVDKISDINALISSLKDETNITKISNLLKAVYGCEIINPQGKFHNYGETASEKYIEKQDISDMNFSGAICGLLSTFLKSTIDSSDLGVEDWNIEIDAIVEIVHVVAKYDIYGAIQDPDLLTTNQGIASLATTYHIDEVFTAVGDSCVVKSVIGTLLDDKLQSFGILTDGASFSNITDWDKEGKNFKDLLLTVGAMSTSLTELDLTALTAPTLNNLLHSLYNSQIFSKTENQVTTNFFPNWLLTKLDILKTGDFAILGDPTGEWIWEGSRGELDDSGKSYTIIEHDFNAVNDWSSPNFVVDNTWDVSSDTFEEDYQEVFELDELGRLSKVIYYATSLLGGNLSLDTLTAEDLDNVLSAVNDTTCLRIGVYNLFDMAGGMLGGNDMFSLDAANFKYLVSCGETSLANTETVKANRQVEIDALVDMFDAFTSVTTGDKPLIAEGGFNLDNATDEVVDKLSGAVKGLARTKVFHCLGPATIDDTKAYNPTVVQSLMKTIMGVFESFIYNEQSPKDIHFKSEYLKYGDTASAGKLNYLVFNTFTYKNLTNDKLDAVCSEIDNIFEVVKTAASSGLDITNLDINNINESAIVSVLKSLNNSKVLMDSVPNMYNTIFSSDAFGALEGVNFQDANPYYVYDGGLYDVKYDESELDNLEALIGCFKDLSNDLGSGSLTSGKSLTSLIDSGKLSNLLKTMHDSKVLHLANKNYCSTDVNAPLTVFEQVVAMLINKSTLDTYISNDSSAVNALVKSRIRTITLAEKENTTLTTGYNDVWFKGTNNKTTGEMDAIFNLFKTAIKAVGAGDSDSELSINISLDTMDPETISGLLTAINGVDTLDGALRKIVGDAFTTMGLKDLTTAHAKELKGFDENQTALTMGGVDFANYELSQYQFGGNRAGEGVKEIETLVNLMSSIAEYEGETFKGYKALGDVNSLISDETTFASILTFVNDSQVFAKETEDFGGYKVTARGMLMFNLLTAGEVDGGTGLSSYMSGSSTYEEVAIFSDMFTIEGDEASNGFNPQYEAKGLIKLISSQDKLDDMGTFSNLEDESTAQLFTTIFEASYNVDGNNHRSYFTSELASGVLNSLVLSEKDNIDTRYSYITSTYTQTEDTVYNSDFMFGLTGTYSQDNKLTSHSYDSISKVELDGLLGSVDVVKELTKFIDTGLDSYDLLKEGFAKINESEFGKVIYLSRIHKAIDTIVVRETLDYNPVWSDFAVNPNMNTLDFNYYATSLVFYLSHLM